jgi:hypothetical protein
MLERADSIERLREALISLERSRRRERELRSVEACLVEVARVLALAEHPQETFVPLFEVLRSVLPFQDAAVLAPAEDGELRSTACTNAWMSRLGLAPGRMRARAARGQIVVLFDAELVPEWRDQPEEVRARVRSVIHMPLRTGVAPVVLVCTHEERAVFEQRHAQIAKRLLPLAEPLLAKLALRGDRREPGEAPRWAAANDAVLVDAAPPALFSAR